MPPPKLPLAGSSCDLRHFEVLDRSEQERGRLPEGEIHCSSVGPAYAAVVLGMFISENATAEDIANYLFKVGTEHMALPDRDIAKLCETAAAAIVALRSKVSVA